MAFLSSSRIYLSLSLVLATTSSILPVYPSPSSMAAVDRGFSVELIHWDSPESPYYNPNETVYQRLHRALNNTLSRANHLAMSGRPGNSPTTLVFPDPVGYYLMKISVGTPPSQVLGILDTGSYLIWTQCKPCYRCFPQTGSPFDPSTSSTYRDESCHSESCKSVPFTKCPFLGTDKCEYSIRYRDGSFTKGVVALDTFTFDSNSGPPVSFPQIIFGCGHDNGGPFFKGAMSGVIGLGGGQVSLLSQMGEAAGGKFSYCLVPFNPTSMKNYGTLNFGSGAVVSGAGTVSTPMVCDTLYYLVLKAISVRTHRIEFESNSDPTSPQGNIIIDAGAMLSLVPQDFYSQLESVVSSMIELPRVPDPMGFSRLCYSTTTEIDAPILTAHFKGADVTLPPSNTFLRVTDATVCFSFVPISRGHSIYGNLLQRNFLIGYDTQNQMLSFKPANCAIV